MESIKENLVSLLASVFVLLLVTLLVWFLYNYIIAPAFNIQTIGYWVMFAILYIISIVGHLFHDGILNKK